jgi:hypothetical protein
MGGYRLYVTTSTHDLTLLGIYLNDHLAGASIGVNLARRLAANEREWTNADLLDRIAGDIAQDRDALMNIMGALDVPIRRYKTWAAWTAERAGRLKLNGRAFTRSPLSRVLELEAMRLGVEGKAAGWRTLRADAEFDDRLDADWLDALIDRAQEQIDHLEGLRIEAAAVTFGGPDDS